MLLYVQTNKTNIISKAKEALYFPNVGSNYSKIVQCLWIGLWYMATLVKPSNRGYRSILDWAQVYCQPYKAQK